MPSKKLIKRPDVRAPRQAGAADVYLPGLFHTFALKSIMERDDFGDARSRKGGEGLPTKELPTMPVDPSSHCEFLLTLILPRGLSFDSSVNFCMIRSPGFHEIITVI